MFADPKQTLARRMRRQVKAGVSIAVAIAAGAWLSLRAGASNAGPSPFGPDARVGPSRAGGSAPPPPPPAGDPGAGGAGEESASDESALATTDAGARRRDAGRDASIVRNPDAARAPQVDRHEHRNGMPVRDNLLE